MYKGEALINPLDHTWQGYCNLMSIEISMVLGLKVCLFVRYSLRYMGLSGDHPLVKLSEATWTGPLL